MIGIHFARNNASGRAYFSPLNNIQAELGADDAQQCSGFRIYKQWDFWAC